MKASGLAARTSASRARLLLIAPPPSTTDRSSSTWPGTRMRRPWRGHATAGGRPARLYLVTPRCTRSSISRAARATSAGSNAVSHSRVSRSLLLRGSKYMPRASSTSEAGGRKSEPSPTERTNPSSTRTRGMPCRAAAASSPAGMRERHTAIAPPVRRAAAVAPETVRRKRGLPPPLPERHADAHGDAAVGGLDPAPFEHQREHLLERRRNAAERVEIACRGQRRGGKGGILALPPESQPPRPRPRQHVAVDRRPLRAQPVERRGRAGDFMGADAEDRRRARPDRRRPQQSRAERGERHAAPARLVAVAGKTGRAGPGNDRRLLAAAARAAGKQQGQPFRREGRAGEAQIERKGGVGFEHGAAQFRASRRGCPRKSPRTAEWLLCRIRRKPNRLSPATVETGSDKRRAGCNTGSARRSAARCRGRATSPASPSKARRWATITARSATTSSFPASWRTNIPIPRPASFPAAPGATATSSSPRSPSLRRRRR